MILGTTLRFAMLAGEPIVHGTADRAPPSSSDFAASPPWEAVRPLHRVRHGKHSLIYPACCVKSPRRTVSPVTAAAKRTRQSAGGLGFKVDRPERICSRYSSSLAAPPECVCAPVG
jgi:hypothetical protein